MEKRNSTSDRYMVSWLPPVLFMFTYFLTGFYYETNDDQLITLLLRGITIQPPLTNLSLYFHGISHGLAALYQWLPQWPWYGLVLYGLLLLATGMAFLFLLRASPRLALFKIIAILVLFYIASWLEHVMWFNYLRVPLLLAGTSYLVLAQLPAAKKFWITAMVTAALFLLALCIRPSGALLGLGLVAPAVLLLPSKQPWRRRFRPVLVFMAAGFIFFLCLQWFQSPATRQYQRLDWLKSTVLDFEIYEQRPQTQSDSLAFRAIGHWLLADTQVLNEAFYQRAGTINLSYNIRAVVPAKLKAFVEVLLRDHFLVSAINAGLLLGFFRYRLRLRINSSMLLAYQVYFWSILFAIALILKLPPRVLTPCLSLYTLVHLAIFMPALPQLTLSASRASSVVALGGLVLVGLQFYKIAHRAAWQQQQQHHHERFITTISQSFTGQVLVTTVFPDYFRSLSPFRNYNFGPNSVFLLTGWSTLDPGYAAYYQKLSRQENYAATVRSLATDPQAIWLLPPGYISFLNQYFNTFHGYGLPLQPVNHPLNQRYPVHLFRSVVTKNTD